MRFLKQLGYGALYLLVFSLIGLGIYRVYFYEAPTCLDNIKNQDETDIDCDGPCISCELKNTKLSVEMADVLGAGEGKVTAMVLVRNPADYSAVFEYSINLVGHLSVPVGSLSGYSSVDPKSERYIVIPGVNVATGELPDAKVEIKNTKWNEVKGEKRRNVEARKIETIIANGEVRVTGVLFNDSQDVVERARATALLYRADGTILGASAVDVESVGISREKAFTVFFPKLEAETELGRIEARVSSEIVPSL